MLTSTHSLMVPIPQPVSTWHLEPILHVFSPALTYTVPTLANFPEHMLSSSDPTFYTNTSEHSRA